MEIIQNKKEITILKKTYLKSDDNLTILNYPCKTHFHKGNHITNDTFLKNGLNHDEHLFVFGVLDKKNTKAIFKMLDFSGEYKKIEPSFIPEKERKKIIEEIEYKNMINHELEMLRIKDSEILEKMKVLKLQKEMKLIKEWKK